MLSSTLTDKINSLLIELEASEELFSGLRILSKAEANIDGLLASIATGGGSINVNSAATNTYNYFDSAKRLLSNIPSRAFFRALDRATNAISNFAQVGGSTKTTSIHLHLEQFSEKFETFLNKQTPVSAVPVLQGSTKLLIEIETFINTLSSIASQLKTPANLNEDEERFSISFPDEESLREIRDKLSALQAIFDLISNLIGHSETTDIRVLKLEYGSLLAELAVSRTILNIARPWISSLAQFFYRTKTIEGSLESTTTASKTAIKHLVDVRKLLQQQGINTKKMDAEIEEIGYEMAKNVNALVKNQIRLKLDEVEIAKTEPPLYLENDTRPMKQLPSPDGQ